jgi:hypothetical protein
VLSYPFVIPLLSVGVPACLFRLWLIWWRSACEGCGLEHRTCECPATEHTMRPRR